MSALDDFLDIHLSHCNIWHSNTGEGCNCGLSEAKQELEQLKEGIKEAKSLLVESKEYVEDMVGIASGARGLPEIITSWLERWGEWIT